MSIYERIKNYLYNDYGIKPETIDKIVHITVIIFKYICLIIGIPLTIIGYIGSLFVLGLVYPLIAIVYILFSIVVLFYVTFRDKLDEKYQIL